MLTKSVKSVISAVLKHVARAKKIRAIGVIREYNIRMVLPDRNIFLILPFCLHSTLFVCTALIIRCFRSVDTICTQLHSSALCLHDVCTSVSTVSARDLHAECLLREAGVPFGATDITTSHSCLAASLQSAHGRVGRVQTSADRG